MSEINTILFDIGGVILSDGWGRASRKQACAKFGLSVEEFQARHDKVADSFEMGKIDLDGYLKETVFYENRTFSKDEFKDFMFAQTRPNETTLDVLNELATTKRYLMCTINNESLALNEFRINKFNLEDYFTAFFSSSFMGIKKPGPEIYQRVLKIIQRRPEQCVFIDDREENLVSPRELGIHCIEYLDHKQLVSDLEKLGVRVQKGQPARL
jgi:putative hydrolase of the HAD superfamily